MHKDMYLKYQASHTSAITSNQRSLDNMGVGCSQEKYGPRNEQQVKMTKSLVDNLIIGCGLPVSIVEHPNFIKFMADTDSKFRLPSRPHVTNKLVPCAKDKLCESVYTQLEKATFVSLTIDIWTDRRMHSFIAATAHMFLDFETQNCLLHFGSFAGSHTGTKIASEVEKVVIDNKLDGKVVYVVSDNASNMKKAFEVLQISASDEQPVHGTSAEDIFDDPTLFEDLDDNDKDEVEQTLDRHCLSRLSCFAHSMQLVVKDGMEKCSSVRPVMAKCCKLASLCHQSALFREQFELAFGEGHSIPSANATRWSSTYHQLSSVLQLEDHKMTELLRQSGHDNLIFSAKDSAALQELVEILQPFAEVTDN